MKHGSEHRQFGLLIVLIGLLTGCAGDASSTPEATSRPASDIPDLPTATPSATPTRHPTRAPTPRPTITAGPTPEPHSPGDPVVSDSGILLPGEVLFINYAHHDPDPCAHAEPLAVNQYDLWAMNVDTRQTRLIGTICQTLHALRKTFSPDGRYLVAEHLMGLSIFDVRQGRRYDYGTDRGPYSNINGAAWSLDSRTLYYTESHSHGEVVTRVLQMPPADNLPETLFEGPQPLDIGEEHAGSMIQTMLPDGRLLYDNLWWNGVPRLIDPLTLEESIVNDELDSLHLDIFDTILVDGTLRVLYRPFRTPGFYDTDGGPLMLAELGPDDRLINLTTLGTPQPQNYYYGWFVKPDLIVGRVMLEEYGGITRVPPENHLVFFVTWDVNNLEAGFTPITPLEIEGIRGRLEWTDFAFLDETRLLVQASALGAIPRNDYLFTVYLDGRPPLLLSEADEFPGWLIPVEPNY